MCTCERERESVCVCVSTARHVNTAQLLGGIWKPHCAVTSISRVSVAMTVYLSGDDQSIECCVQLCGGVFPPC